MARILLGLAVAAAAAPLAAQPAYQATLAAPAGRAGAISSERMWSCRASQCVAGGPASSPAVRICSRLAQELGPVTAFHARGVALSSADLERCNARAQARAGVAGN